jgi:DNA-directed RNA polymerase specialized sigma24 family protein
MRPVESLLAPALAGEPSAVRAVVAAFTPVIAGRAARILARRRDARRDPQQELEEIAEHVLLHLFRDEGRVLRVWQEQYDEESAESVPLLDYVGLVAEQEVARGPAPRTPDAPEAGAGSRDLFDHLHARLAEQHHPRAMEMYRLLVIEDLAIADVCEKTGLSAGAVEAWRSRLLTRARELLVELRALFLSDSAHHRAARARNSR